MLTDIDAVIFDLDGTMVDSMWIWKAIDEEYLGEKNIEMPEDLQKCVEGISFYQVAVYFKERFNIEDSLTDIMDKWNEMAFEKYKYEIKPKPYMIEFLEMLKKNNIKIGVATSNSRPLCDAVLIANDMMKYIDVIQTGCNELPGKPEPDIYLYVADQLGCAPSRCLVFEDLTMGITAGNRAGMRTCAIKDDYSEDQWDEKVSLADYNIKDYGDILCL